MKSRFSALKGDRAEKTTFFFSVCCLLLIVCIAYASLTYGTYLQSENTSNDACVAAMRVEFDGLKDETVSLNNMDDTKGVIASPFRVVRSTEAGDTEVAFRYTISLKLPEGSEWPDYLTVTLIAGDESVAGEYKDGSIVFDKIFYMNLSRSESENYLLLFEVSIPGMVPQSGFGLTGMNVSVHAEQVLEVGA